MDRMQHTNHAKTWEFAEDRAFAHQSQALIEVRASAEQAGAPQTSAAQAELLSLMVTLTGAQSVIAVGTCSLVETLALLEGLRDGGQLTAVDSSAQGIAMIRNIFHTLEDETQTSLRAVNADVNVFLPRLNANDYDLIVVSGDAANYQATLDQAPRLLSERGAIVFTDVLARGGVLDAADRSEKTVAMRAFLESLEANEEFESTLTPDGTGMVIAVKR
ncbi:O-methyltransferase [Bifidobacterium eulemuris]|uniref:Methyltransferase n=1 Tax=Bifidobacterium eulemuris TaxID=1765219 RepID=A0A261GE25_9BIFI|nr:methyltransferase [Bifidobacterium eulemuris]OZG69375.1 methyltransferase [Bifidobacterium eulemuris]QOL31137.1 methyltransferase [Bifidobacterium eulemuris]